MGRVDFLDEERPAGEGVILTLRARVAFRLVWCPPGEYTMGSSESETPTRRNERPPHRVRLSRGFWIGKTPVTQVQWEEVMGQKPVMFTSGGGTDSMPAEGMTWQQSREFCNRLQSIYKNHDLLKEGRRFDLPTEAQWEYATRAGTAAPWFFGDDPGRLEQYGWSVENSRGTKHLVATRAANPWAIQDQYGNVAEWCLDDLYLYTESESVLIDPLYMTAEAVQKVVRGGSFQHPAADCRSAAREFVEPENPYNEPIGMRIVLQSEDLR